MGRVAPLFDASRRLELFEVKSGGVEPSGTLELTQSSPHQRFAAIRERGVDMVICGAISEHAHQALTAGGIQVASWVCGPVDAVLNAYLSNSLVGPAWMLPGCGGRRFRGGRCGRGGGWGGRGFGGGPGGIF